MSPRVKSSAISYVSYTKATSELHILMHDGVRLVYQNVPVEVYNELLQAESKGVYYNLNIRNNYPFEEG